MSLARTALRLATMEALRPTAAIAGNGPWPTLAGGTVFDSRADPIDDWSAAERRPVLVVYTEDDNGDPGQFAGGPPYKRIVDLVIEMSHVSVLADGEQVAAVYSESDAELEAALDLLDAQVRFALHYGPTGAVWRALTGRVVRDIRSSAHRTTEEGVRLSMRTLRLRVMVPDDDYDPAPSPAPAGNDRLPEPLRGVIAALAETAYGAVIAGNLAPAAPVMPVKVPLQSVGLGLDLHQPRDGIADVTADATGLDQ